MKILFADKRMTYEMTRFEDSAIQLFEGPVGEASGWNWPFDKVTSRHTGRGDVVLVDGHVETVRPAFAADPAHFDPLR